MTVATIYAATVALVQPTVRTEPAGEDADDPAVWIHPKDPSRSIARSPGPRFPAGMMIAMNSRDRNFLIYRWEDVSRAARLR